MANILPYINTCFEVFSLWSGEKHPARFRIPLWCPLLDIFVVSSFKAVSYSAFGVKVKVSSVPYDSFECRVVPGRPFGAEELVGYHW